jgi:hypothetical protein
MKLTVFILLGTIILCWLIALLARRIRYAITHRHLKVTLFGLCLRRIKLADIDSISKRRANRAERWYNTLHPSHRVLVVRRRRGWLKDFMITPSNRYVFKAELERALAKLRAEEQGDGPGDAQGDARVSSAG